MRKPWQALVVPLLLWTTLFIATQPLAIAEGTRSAIPASAKIQQNETVMFNTHSLKYHKPNCEWAIRCTRNCIPLSKSEAIRRNGIPCRVCGG